MRKLFLILLGLSVAIAAFAADPYFLFSPKGIAEVEIQMLNGKNFWDIWVNENTLVDGEVVEIREAEKLDARMRIKNSSNSSYSESHLYDGKIRIRGRGNTSFHNDKRGYNIELVTESNDERENPLLGMEAHDEWALMSNYNDRSFMRMPLALWLGRQMTGLDYAAEMNFVEVYIVNDKWERIDYRGLFCLSEKANTRGNGRVALQKLTKDAPADQVLPNVSGGYLIEVVPNDKMKNQAEFNTKFRMPGWEGDGFHHYVFQYPSAKNVTQAQREYMIQYMTEVYNVLYGENFTDPVNGYAKYIDVNSFIDWCILHDLSKGTDNLFHASVFLQKDRNEKLRMTAPWDFDISFGNIEKENGCYYEDGFWIKNTHYYNRLWEDPLFREKLKARYDELMPIFDMVPYVLQENYKFLEETGVLDREFARFGESCLENFRYSNDVKTYKGHIRYLTEWFESRKAWLYYNLGETPEERCERMQEIRPVMRVMQPENLLNCTSTLTSFMRGYTYNLDKGESGRQDAYGSDWYEIKRNDGEYTVEIVSENGCVSIPSLPVQFCEERVYDAPTIIEPPLPPDAEDYWIKEDFSQFPTEANYNTTNSYLTFPNNIALVADSANIESGEGCTAGAKILRIRGARFEGGSAEFTVPNAGKVTMTLTGKSTNKDRTIYIYRNGNLMETLTGLDRNVCKNFEETVNSNEPQTYKIIGGNNTHQPVAITSIIVEKYDGSASINAVNYSSLAFYPNPVNDVVYFSQNVDLASVYNTSGQLVFLVKNANQMNVQDLNKGIYVIKILTTNGTITGKLIKE